MRDATNGSYPEASKYRKYAVSHDNLGASKNIANKMFDYPCRLNYFGFTHHRHSRTQREAKRKAGKAACCNERAAQ